MAYRGKIINEIADLISEDVAIVVAQKSAGRILYISNKQNSALVKDIGDDYAEKLFDVYGNTALKIPFGEQQIFAIKKKLFFKCLDAGKSVAKAQTKCGISERCSWNWKRDWDRSDSQDETVKTSLPLFDL